MASQKTAVTLFIDTESWVQRLHPLTKLSYILLLGVAVYLGPGLCRLWGPYAVWALAVPLLAANFLFAASGGILKATCRNLGRIMLPLLVFMIPIHGLLYPGNRTALLDIQGIIVYREGLFFAFATLLKLAVVLTASLLFVFSTHPADLITALANTCKSPSLAYLFGSPLLLLASMRERIDIIQAAQRARGLQTEGNVFRRFYSLAPLVVPLVIGAIVDIEQRAIALEVRGFKSPSLKTSLRTLTDSALQRQVRRLMLATAAILVVVRVVCYVVASGAI